MALASVVNNCVAWLREELETSRGEHRSIRAMEGLRGFAVFLVFLVHYITLSSPWVPATSALSRPAEWLHSLGNAGVDLFFVLSGYLIYGALIAKPQQFTRYMRRRVRRIYPTFSAVFALYVALSLVVRGESKLPDSSAGTAVYLLQNFFLLPGLVDIRPMISVAWSLSYEMFYYLTIPLVISVLRLRNWSPEARIALLIVGSLTGFVYFGAFGGPVRLLMFLSGILLYELTTYWKASLPSSAGLLFALVVQVAALVLIVKPPPALVIA